MGYVLAGVSPSILQSILTSAAFNHGQIACSLHMATLPLLGPFIFLPPSPNAARREPESRFQRLFHKPKLLDQRGRAAQVAPIQQSKPMIQHDGFWNVKPLTRSMIVRPSFR